MIRKILVTMVGFLVISVPVLAQSITPQIGGGIRKGFDGGISGTSAPADAPQTTAFLARANAVTTLDTTHTNAYKALINGGVADGWFQKMDVFYLFATQSSGVAFLNLVSSSFTGSTSGSVNFVTDRGFSGASSSSYLTSGFDPTTPLNFTQNSASVSVWSNTAGAESAAQAGSDINSIINAIFIDASGSTTMRINDSSASGAISSTPDGSGFYLGSRTSSSVRSGYWNGTSLGSTNSVTSQPVNVGNFVFLNNATAGGLGSTKQISAGSVGGALTPTDASNMYSRMRTYMTAVGVP